MSLNKFSDTCFYLEDQKQRLVTHVRPHVEIVTQFNVPTFEKIQSERRTSFGVQVGLYV